MVPSIPLRYWKAAHHIKPLLLVVKARSDFLPEVQDSNTAGRAGAPRAILIFLPGAPEINRLVRVLQGSTALQQACQGRKPNVLPLHGALAPAQQVSRYLVLLISLLKFRQCPSELAIVVWG